MNKVITNNHPRNIIDAWELTPTEQAEFDYLDWPRIMAGEDSASFFRYRGELYDLGEFTRGGCKGWDGSKADSFFSGIVIRLVDNNERIVVGLWLA